MKLEIIKEQKFGENPWYGVYVDDEYVKGGFILKNVEEIFETIKADPKNFKLNTKEIFKSEEIDLSLPEEKENNN